MVAHIYFSFVLCLHVSCILNVIAFACIYATKQFERDLHAQQSHGNRFTNSISFLHALATTSNIWQWCYIIIL